MNIFVLNEDPVLAAQDYCDKHVPKLIVEMLQMCGSAVIRHGATPDMMPLTKKGTPLKGGYHKHPCTVWCGDSRNNFLWAVVHGLALCDEYSKRFGKTHFCETGLEQLFTMSQIIPAGNLTPFALAMPDEYRPVACHIKDGYLFHATGSTAVAAYRRYYHSKTFAKWDKGTDTPSWWVAA